MLSRQVLDFVAKISWPDGNGPFAGVALSLTYQFQSVSPVWSRIFPSGHESSEALRRCLRSHPESKIERVLSLVPKGAHGIHACGSYCGDQAGGNRNEQ